MLQLPCGKKLGEVPEPRSYAWLRWEFRLVRAEAVNGEWQRMVVGRPWLRSAVFEPPPLVLGGSRPLPTPGGTGPRGPAPGATVDVVTWPLETARSRGVYARGIVYREGARRVREWRKGATGISICTRYGSCFRGGTHHHSSAPRRIPPNPKDPSSP